MRVAIVIDSLLRAGAERQALFTARGLASRGCEVDLIHYYPGEAGYAGAVGTARMTYLPKHRHYLRFLRRLSAYLRRGRFDVVHSFKGNACVYGGFAARMAGAPVILGGYRQEYDEPGPKRLVYRALDRAQTGWVVNSRAIVDSLVREIGADRARCFVVDNAIEAEPLRSTLSREEARRRLQIDPACSVVSMIAHFRPQKNHGLLLEVATGVLRQRPDVRFLLIGEGPERSMIEARVDALGLRDRVLLLGDRHDIPDLLRATDISILTSSYEGVSNALMESMCVGLPVVSTAYAGADELITEGEDGRLVPLADPAAFTDCLLALLADPAARERLGATARRTIESRYSLEAMGETLLSLYEDRLRHVQKARPRR